MITNKNDVPNLPGLAQFDLFLSSYLLIHLTLAVVLPRLFFPPGFVSFYFAKLSDSNEQYIKPKQKHQSK